MKRHSKVITVEYVVQDCPICGKIVVKHCLYPKVDKIQEQTRRCQRR